VFDDSHAGFVDTLEFRIHDAGLDGIDSGVRIDNIELIVAGDFNRDGRVDANDFWAWRAGFGATRDATPADGDADGDNDVDGYDFLAWQQDYGTGLGLAATSSAVADSALTGGVGSHPLRAASKANDSASRTDAAFENGIVSTLGPAIRQSLAPATAAFGRRSQPDPYPDSAMFQLAGPVPAPLPSVRCAAILAVAPSYRTTDHGNPESERCRLDDQVSFEHFNGLLAGRPTLDGPAGLESLTPYGTVFNSVSLVTL